MSRPKANDLLKCKGGPAAKLSSYREEYPGHRGKNQYVPMNPELFRGGLDLCGSTIYSKEYIPHSKQRAGSAKPHDQFSMGGSWLGGSTYSDSYKEPKKTGRRQGKCGKGREDSVVKMKNPSIHFGRPGDK